MYTRHVLCILGMYYVYYTCTMYNTILYMYCVDYYIYFVATYIHVPRPYFAQQYGTSTPHTQYNSRVIRMNPEFR